MIVNLIGLDVVGFVVDVWVVIVRKVKLFFNVLFVFGGVVEG